MNIYAHDELFRMAGPDEALDYLWGRLQDRDLSQDEALALLSAVHRQLSQARGGDSRPYFAYTRFMESFSREMPVVHDYVVSRWIESRHAGRMARAASAASAASHVEQQVAPQGDGHVADAAAGSTPEMQGEGDEPSPVT